MTPDQKEWIDKASLEQLLRRWRFASLGDDIMQGDAGKYYGDRMFAMREADPAAWTAASKTVGWDGHA